MTVKLREDIELLKKQMAAVAEAANVDLDALEDEDTESEGNEGGNGGN